MSALWLRSRVSWQCFCCTSLFTDLESYSPNLLPGSPGYRRARLPIGKRHTLPGVVMTGKEASEMAIC